MKNALTGAQTLLFRSESLDLPVDSTPIREIKVTHARASTGVRVVVVLKELDHFWELHCIVLIDLKW